MRIVGFNFTKIEAEKFSDKLDKIKLKTNIEFTDLKPVKSNIIKTKEEFLGVNFIYSIDYGSEFGKIGFSGNILVSVESKKAKGILKEWENKKIPSDLKVYLLNVILRKGNIKAFELEDEMNFPLHMKMPSVNEDQIKTNNNK